MVETVDLLWITAGLGCDGDTIALTAATNPSLEDLLDGLLPDLPRVRFHNQVLAPAVGDDFLAPFHQATRGELAPFILVVEGSIPDESLAGEGYFAALGLDPESGEPIRTTTWIDRLAPRAWAVVAVGTCAAYGGVHAMEGNPTGCGGLPDYLGWDWTSAGGMRVISVPGCPVQPDNLMEVLVYLLRQRAGLVPPIALDASLRPEWLFGGRTLHECCDRAGFYEEASFADRHGRPECIVKLGCWGPVVDCNVGKRGWVNGVGGCANVGGVCIGCTMPGFPDKFTPFMDQPPGSQLSSAALATYGHSVRALRGFTRAALLAEPPWRQPRRSPVGGAKREGDG